MSYLFLFKDRLTWNIPLLIVILLTVFLYVRLLKRTTTIKVNHRQPILFLVGLCLFLLMVGSPLTALSHLSFSLHMIQMSVLYFIVPPLLLLGIPREMYLFISGKIQFKKSINGLFLAKIFLYIFSILLFIYHLPVVIQMLSASAVVQNVYLFLLFALTFGMWWPIVSPDSKQRLSGNDLKRYVYLSGLVITPACLIFIVTAFLNSIENPFISQITAHLCLPGEANSFALLPPPFNTKYDQFMAGTFMLALHKFGLFMTTKIEAKVLRDH